MPFKFIQLGWWFVIPSSDLNSLRYIFALIGPLMEVIWKKLFQVWSPLAYSTPDHVYLASWELYLLILRGSTPGAWCVVDQYIKSPYFKDPLIISLLSISTFSYADFKSRVKERKKRFDPLGRIYKIDLGLFQIHQNKLLHLSSVPWHFLCPWISYSHCL